LEPTALALRKSTTMRVPMNFRPLCCWLSFLVAIMLNGAALAQNDRNEQAKRSSPVTQKPIYNKQADAREQVATATAQAKRDSKRVLLVFGGDSCGWCHKLHALSFTNPEICKTLIDEYVAVMVELESPNASELLKTCKAALSSEELQKGVGYPFLAVLDSEGKVVTAQRTEPLEDGDHHHPQKVQEFLSRWIATPKDANLVVEEALARASSEHKRVLLVFGAPSCGWCHRLEDWLAQPDVAATMARDFNVAKIDVDRMTHGNEVLLRYRTKDSGGIPWYTILDSKGTKLATADGPDGYMGYPLEPNVIDQFLAMVQAQSQHIQANHLEQLKRSLLDAAEKIKDARGAPVPRRKNETGKTD
jgi:thioredoxin-related protein